MDQTDETDLKIQRVLGSKLHELTALLPQCLWRKTQGVPRARVSRPVMRQRDLHKILGLIDPFQEDPQLLDAHLKHLLPPLVEAYIASIDGGLDSTPGSKHVKLACAILRIINMFCKVRGEKVIVGFLNNEPRYLEPILVQLQIADKATTSANTPDAGDEDAKLWQERYVLLLWLSHLMLTPFDLSTISSEPSTLSLSKVPGLTLPLDLPSVIQRVLPFAFLYLRSATKERAAACGLLVRVVLRPDMQKLGLLDAIIVWALSHFEASGNELPDIHETLGVLAFISKLASVATLEEAGSHFPGLFRACQRITENSKFSVINSSAVARKLVIKAQRDILIHWIKSEGAATQIDTSTALEDVIDHLLQSMADSDTLVRYAASKALSALTLKLKPGLAADVIEAVLGCLNENVLWRDSKPDLSSVNPLRWHGLTLTLAHLLYRKAPGSSQLPDVLNALLLALAFEQRSTNGSSIGSNVRDAACFGIWAMSRRYSTADLLSINVQDIRAASAASEDQTVSLPQRLAMELVVSACLDPAGNIRRGSSAALQELIGRHPDIISAGIPLVQTVDFHAVGLRDRALKQVALEAAKLDHMYWIHLFSNMLGWRGLGAVDAASRLSTADALASLSALKDVDTVIMMITRLSAQLTLHAKREVEERHGVMSAIAAITSTNVDASSTLSLQPELGHYKRTNDDLKRLDLSDVLRTLAKLDEKDYTSTALRPELTATSVCRLVTAIADLSSACDDADTQPRRARDLHPHLELCMRRSDPSVLKLIPLAVRSLAALDPSAVHNWAMSWQDLLQLSSTYSGTRADGAAFALSAANRALMSDASSDVDLIHQIISTLTDRATPKASIHNRVIALQSLHYIVEDLVVVDSINVQDLTAPIGVIVLASLNDYTINERGDVGANLRLEGLKCMSAAWKYDRGGSHLFANDSKLHAAVYRLSLEKLDKIRTQAAQALSATGRDVAPGRPQVVDQEGTSSLQYFCSTLQSLLSTKNKPGLSPSLISAIYEGYFSSAGAGSEAVLQSSRSALAQWLRALPIGTTRDESGTLFGFAHHLSSLLSGNVSQDRIAIPTLEVLAYCLDIRVLHVLDATAFSWRSLLSAVQTAHFKSTNLQKLHLALEVYRGLADITSIRELVVKKIISMLMHPYPTVRVAAAEALFTITGDDNLRNPDWSRTAKTLKPVVEAVQASVRSRVV